MSKFSPFPFLYTVEDVQELIVSLSPFSKGESAIIDHINDPVKFPNESLWAKVERRFYETDYEDGELRFYPQRNFTIDDWSDPQENILYTLNYEDFGDIVLHPEFTEVFYNHRGEEISIYQELFERALPQFERIESKLESATFERKEKRELERVIREYLCHKNYIDILHEEQKEITSNWLYEGEKKSQVIAKFLDLTKSVLTKRVEYLTDYYSDYYKEVLENLLDEFGIESEVAQKVRQEEEALKTKVLDNLQNHGLLIDFKTRLSDHWEDAIAILAKTFKEGQYDFLSIEKIPKARYYVLCHCFGIIEDYSKISGVNSKSIAKLLQTLYNLKTLTKESKADNLRYNFQTYYEVRRTFQHKRGAFNTESDKLYNSLKEVFPKARLVPPTTED